MCLSTESSESSTCASCDVTHNEGVGNRGPRPILCVGGDRATGRPCDPPSEGLMTSHRRPVSALGGWQGDLSLRAAPWLVVALFLGSGTLLAEPQPASNV